MKTFHGAVAPLAIAFALTTTGAQAKTQAGALPLQTEASETLPSGATLTVGLGTMTRHGSADDRATVFHSDNQSAYYESFDDVAGRNALNGAALSFAIDFAGAPLQLSGLLSWQNAHAHLSDYAVGVAFSGQRGAGEASTNGYNEDFDRKSSIYLLDMMTPVAEAGRLRLLAGGEFSWQRNGSSYTMIEEGETSAETLRYRGQSFAIGPRVRAEATLFDGSHGGFGLTASGALGVSLIRNTMDYAGIEDDAIEESSHHGSMDSGMNARVSLTASYAMGPRSRFELSLSELWYDNVASAIVAERGGSYSDLGQGMGTEEVSYSLISFGYRHSF